MKRTPPRPPSRKDSAGRTPQPRPARRTRARSTAKRSASKAPAKGTSSKTGGTLEALIADALSVRKKAYAPYSNFRVGAALLGESGKVYLGCNVENSSYGLCVCAERSAIARAVADGERKFKGIVIATQSAPPSPPCGMCRQTLSEFAPDLDMLLVNEAGARVKTSLSEIFPMSFTNSYL